MSISNPTNVAGPFTPDGIATVYPFTFLALSADQLAVYQNGAILSPTLYAVSLSGEGGSVTFASPLTASSGPFYIVGDPDFVQGITPASVLLPGVIAGGFDASVARDIALQAQVGRALTAPLGEPGLTLPSLANRQGKAAGFDAVSGNLIPIGGVVNLTGSQASSAVTASGGETTLNIGEPVALAALVELYRNGVKQSYAAPQIDYTANGTNFLTLTMAAVAGETFRYEVRGGISADATAVAATKLPLAGGVMTGTLQAYALTNTDGMPNLAQVGGEPQSNTHTRLEFNTFPSINPFQPVSVQLHSRHYASRNNSNVAFTVITDSGPGSGDIWAINAATYPGLGSPAAMNAFVFEGDINNSSRHYGDTPFSYTGATGDFICAHNISVGVIGSGLYRLTAAYLGVGVGGQVYNRMFAGQGDCVAQAFIADDTNSPVILRASGAHGLGIDLSRATGMTAAMTIPNNAVLTWARTDTGAVNVRVAGDNTLRLGEGSAGVYSGSNVIPTADNAYALGASGARWSGAYFATAPTVSSSITGKTDVEDMPDPTDLLLAMRLVTFRNKVGGQVETPARVTVTRDVLDADGVPVMGDPESVLDEDGKPVLEKWEAKHARALKLLSPTEAEAVAAGRPIWRPKTTRRPKRETVEVDGVDMVERPGKRRHAGVIFEELAPLFAKFFPDEDFGVLVNMPDGTGGVRNDPLSYMLMRGFQSLAARVAALEARS